MTETADSASRWIAALLKAEVTNVAPHPEGGWTFEAKGIPAYGNHLVDDHDQFDYCLLDPENDEEVGKHRETMMFSRTEPGGGRTLLIEGLYERRMGDRDRADATFDGRVALVPDGDLPSLASSFSSGFAHRTLGEQLASIGYVTGALGTVRRFLKRPVGADSRRALLAKIADLNRAVSEIMETDVAA